MIPKVGKINVLSTVKLGIRNKLDKKNQPKYMPSIMKKVCVKSKPKAYVLRRINRRYYSTKA